MGYNYHWEPGALSDVSHCLHRGHEVRSLHYHLTYIAIALM